MKTVGVICEYNPFHNGHARQLAHISAQDGAAVCLMSGNYVQRGEPAIFDKLTRAKAAVLCGAALVLELPITCALRSAEGFADGAVDIFERLGCVDALCFGSERDDLNALLSTTQVLDTPEFSAALKRELAGGVSFPAARQRALESLGADSSALQMPNSILAVEYCKALLRRDSRISPMVLRRDGAYHGGSERAAPSASYLRTATDWEGFVPEAALACYREAVRHTLDAGQRAYLARLRALREEEFEALPYGGEGLWRKLMRACREKPTLREIVEEAKSKRYTHTRLMRMLLCAYLGISREMLHAPAPYVRVLATDARGQEILRRAKKEGSLPLLHIGTRAESCAYSELERRSSDLYSLFAETGEMFVNSERNARIFRC